VLLSDVLKDRIDAVLTHYFIQDKNRTESVAHAETRHRAALGITEQTDAVAISVSEQTGSISIAKSGKLYYNVSHKEFIPLLEKLLK